MNKVQAAARSLAANFKALDQRWFRWFWLGRAASAASFQMRGVARGWLVYDLTGSALALSWVGASWGAASFLFSLVGGTASDRVDKRRLITSVQAISTALPLGIALLIFSDAIRVWHLAASTFLLGALFSFVIPARRTLMTELMPRKALMNAMALSTVGMALTGTFSSSLGGALIEKIGPATVYLLIAFLFGVTAWIYFQLPDQKEAPQESGSVQADLLDGGRYLLRRPKLAGILALELGRVILYRPYIALLPVFAADVFEAGAGGLGMLKGASAIGGLLGSLVVASLGDMRGKGWLLLGAGVLSGTGLIFLGQAPSFIAALLSLLLATIGGSAYMVTRSTLLQTTSNARMRGRMVGFIRLIWGLMPLGALPIGALADVIGAPLTVTLEGMAIVALFALAALFRPQLRELS